MTNRRPIPIASPSWRSTRAHSAWNVPAWTSRPPSPTRLMIRSRSSAAALVRERDGQDLPRRDALDPDEVGDPVGQHAGLARTGAGEDEQRALRRRDRARLLGVEGLDDLRLARRAAGGDRRRVRGRWRRGRRDPSSERPRRSPRAATRARPATASTTSPTVVPTVCEGVVEGRVAAAATGGGTHLPILGGRAHPGLNRRAGPGPPAGP